MEYEIVQHADDIEVFYKEEEILKVLRKHDWWGTLHSKFYRSNVLILECAVRVLFFKKNITIKYQSLDSAITLLKSKEGRFLVVNDDRLMMKKTWIKNPIYSLYRNGNVCAEVHIKYRGFTLPPYRYKIVFQEAAADNIYGLIWLLMNFPTMD